MSQSHQLAAIMFTDIVGYTALMGNDEKKAITLLDKNRRLQKPVIEEFNGRWIKELGDGVMASFPTVSDAVNAAIKIQEKCNAANDFKLRIGIHLGEVVFENDDVFGDGVNIAARIQAAASPGCIFISESVHHNIANKKDIKTRFVKEEILKNVSQPVRMYQVLFDGSEIIPSHPSGKVHLPNAGNKVVHQAKHTWKRVSGIVIVAAIAIVAYYLYQRKPAYEPGATERSIAVLPFVNMSNDPEQEYFSDGISEDIINDLAQVSQLKVIGRTSSFAMKGKNMDLKLIGEQLKVAYILEGSVRRSGNKLRVTAQLIKVSDGFHLYSEEFDRELVDVFAIQDEISHAILNVIKIKLFGAEKESVLKKYTDNVEAYQLVLKARYHYNKPSPDNFLKAIEYYQSAIDIDSNYAIAYAGMGHCYWDMAFFNWAPGVEYVPKALAAINKALEMDPHNDICLVAKGMILIWYEWNFNQAGIYLKEAIQINPNNVEGHRQLGVLNMLLGNYEESFKHYEKAEDLDPFSLLGLFYHGGHQFLGGFYERAIDYGNRLIALEPNFFGGHHLLGSGYLFSKQYGKAIEFLETAVKLNSGLVSLMNLGMAYAEQGDRRKAEDVLAKMQTRAFPNEGNAYFGGIYFAMKDYDRAFDYCMKAAKNHEGVILYARISIREAAKETPELLHDPRTIALLKMIGLPN